ncbi:AAA family ATPase [Curtobacterium sp. NPDC089185]|uniref:AAA family ATPase n=1 Tax=Curtobacterium sp. NPDC089185 TaxID=3154968 RepID=UPI0034262B85
MKLVQARIRRYRSIEDATEFAVEPDVTCLVGKNESGKTATLQALYKSRPIATAPFDEGLDYPSHKSRELLRSDGPIEVTVLQYALEDGDVAAVEAELGEGALKRRQITVTTGYRYSGSTWDAPVNEDRIVAHLLGSMELPPTVAAAAQAATTVTELVAALESMEGPTTASGAALAKVRSWRKQDPALQAIDILNARRPMFVYFGDYDNMPGKVSIPRLITKRDADDLTRGERALLALLDLAGVALEDFSNPESHEHLIRRLENASNSISDEVFEYWSQNKNLQVQLAVIPEPEAGAAAPLDRGPLLQIRVQNLRHRVTVPFDERSRGFVWFFSFLAYFSQIEQEAAQPLILLLDEPGLSLHATAQHDLLRFIDDRLAPDHQVLFSTHSPFMVDAGRFNRVRTVVDEESAGTRVSADVLRVDGESAFPLHAALGIELTQTLFVGPNVLFVEGPSDVVFLQYLSDELQQAGRDGLDERWVIVPGGGISKLPAFLTLFGANELRVAVLTDSSSANTRTISELRSAGKLYQGGIVEVGHALGRSEADIEDILDRRTYLELVNAAFAGVLSGSPITLDELNGSDRVVHDVDAVFAARGVNGGRYNHFSPAGALLRSRSRRKPNKAVLDAAEKLVHAINRNLD